MKRKIILSFALVNLFLLVIFHLVYRAALDVYRSPLQHNLYALIRLAERLPVEERPGEFIDMAGTRLLETVYLLDNEEFYGRIDLTVKAELADITTRKEYFNGRKLYKYYPSREGRDLVLVMAVPENIWKTGILKVTGLLVLFVVATNIIFFLITRLFLIRPMEYISLITDRIRQGDYDARVEIEGSREVVNLADNINNMAETIKNDIALLNLVIENMKLGFLVYNDEGEVVLINREAKKTLKISEGDPVTPHFPFLPANPSESRQGFFAGAKIYDRAGAPLFADVALSSFQQGEGFSHALALQEIEDISRHNNSHLISFMRSLTLMLAHEIKNPLNVMGMITQMAEKKFGPDPMWEDIRNEERNITTVIDTFSSFFTINPRPFEIGDFIVAWVEKWKKIYAEKGLLLETRLDKAGMVDFDSQRLEMILNNLVKNTLENGKPGCRALLDLSDRDDKIYLVLTDDTGGIKKETLFKFLDGGHSTKDASRGWGLALVRLLLNLGGADLEIKGGTGKETEVRLVFEKYESPHR